MVVEFVYTVERVRRFTLAKCPVPSSETQRQIVRARESLNGRENMARRKVKNCQKSPWGQCLTRPVPNDRRHSGFWLGRKTQKFSGTNQKPERQWPSGTGLVRHCPQGLFWPYFTFLRALFFRPFRLSLAPTICPWVSEDGNLGPSNQSTESEQKAILINVLTNEAKYTSYK